MRGGDAVTLLFTILFNILLFAASTFGTSVLIEKYYHGRLKWILVPSFTLIAGSVLVKTDFTVMVLQAITNTFALQHLGLILAGGIITGIFFSFL